MFFASLPLELHDPTTLDNREDVACLFVPLPRFRFSHSTKTIFFWKYSHTSVLFFVHFVFRSWPDFCCVPTSAGQDACGALLGRNALFHAALSGIEQPSKRKWRLASDFKVFILVVRYSSR